MTDEQWSSVLTVTLTARCAAPAVMRHMIDAGIEGDRQQRVGRRLAARPNSAITPLQRRVDGTHPVCGDRGSRTRHQHQCGCASIAMHAFLEKVSDPDLLDDLASGEAFGRAAEPWEVANVMVFLASDLAGYMTGEIVSVSSQHP